MGRWIEDSDAVVLERGDLGLSDANVDYLYKHFACRVDISKTVRIYIPRFSTWNRAILPPSVQSFVSTWTTE